ncbi:MAG: hypothetical protein ABGW74_06765 [Campylobacterales bacterium]
MKNLFYLFIFFTSLNAVDIEMVVSELNLSAGSKAAIQWKRVFRSERKMKRYKIDTLDDNTKVKLQEYLINHAIDSDQPTVAGGF